MIKIRHVEDDTYINLSKSSFVLIELTVVVVSYIANFFLFKYIIQKYPFQNELVMEENKPIKFF
jgi:hypothetical protein